MVHVFIFKGSLISKIDLQSPFNYKMYYSCTITCIQYTALVKHNGKYTYYRKGNVQNEHWNVDVKDDVARGRVTIIVL